MKLSQKAVYGAIIIAAMVFLLMCLNVHGWLKQHIPVRLPTTETTSMPVLDIAVLTRASFSRRPQPAPEPRSVPVSVPDKLQIQRCVIGADRDIETGHSRFWSTSLFGVPVEHIRWKCHDYLSRDSVIVEIGGNIGIDAEEFIKRYDSKLVTFEPLPSYAKLLKEKFGRNPDVKVFALGLGNRDHEAVIKVTGHDGDASSMFNTASTSTGERIVIRNSTEVLAQIGLATRSIDLLHMNCEGCEFDVLEALVYSQMIFNVKNIQFATHAQFTDRIPNLTERYCMLQEVLKRSHRIHYQYKFNWESWSLK